MSRSRLALLVVAVIGAVALTVLGLSVSFWLAFGGFLVVLAVAVALEREVRLLARERLARVADQCLARRRPSRRRATSTTPTKDVRVIQVTAWS